MVIKKLKFFLVGSPEGTKTKAFVFFAVKTTLFCQSTPTTPPKPKNWCIYVSYNMPPISSEESFILEEN